MPQMLVTLFLVRHRLTMSQEGLESIVMAEKDLADAYGVSYGDMWVPSFKRLWIVEQFLAASNLLRPSVFATARAAHVFLSWLAAQTPPRQPWMDSSQNPSILPIRYWHVFRMLA
jgi:hypothetical protein